MIALHLPMAAILLMHKKEWAGDEIIEVKVWKVEKSTNYPEGINYRMVYIKRGKRLLGYDNNTSEGHHKHRHGKKTPIRFINLEHLFKQFIKEIQRMRGERK